MNIDYTKPILNTICPDNDMKPHFRFCPKCGQRYVLWGGWDFQTKLMIFRNSIQCPSCGETGAGEPYNEDYQITNN